MKKIRIALFLAFVLGPLFSMVIPLSGYGASSGDSVYIIPIEETVEKGLYAFINRSITEAEEMNVDAIILELDTPGGVVDAAEKITTRIKKTDIPVIAFVNNDAISAGAFIALHADEIYMAQDGKMGASAIIDGEGNAADKKSQSYWLAAMKNAAELHGRDPLYAMAMADESIDVSQYGAGPGELLTLTANQALEVNYAEGIVKDRAQLLERLGYKDALIQEGEVSFAEKIARFLTHPVVVPILLSIGSLGLVLELYSPGFGVPGIMGISSLLLFFYGHLVAGLAGFESLILFVAGIILILIEFFVPSGLIGIFGVGSILTSFFIATDDVGQMVVSLLIAIGVTIVVTTLIFTIFGKRIRLFKRIVLTDSTSTEEGYVSNINRDDLIGKRGISLTTLRPSGTAVIEDERLDVVTEGGYIAQNRAIEVIKTEGVRIVVREVVSEK